MATLGGGQRNMDIDYVRMRDPADGDADLSSALGGQLVDEHRALASSADADQPSDVRLTRTSSPHLGNRGARKDNLYRAVQRLFKNAKQQRCPPLQRDERASIEDEPSHAAWPGRPAC